VEQQLLRAKLEKIEKDFEKILELKVLKKTTFNNKTASKQKGEDQ